MHSEVAAISSQTERIEMEEGSIKTTKTWGGYNADMQSSGTPNDYRLEEVDNKSNDLVPPCT